MSINHLTPERDSVNLMIREHYALTIHEQAARIADLESSLDAYRVTLQQAIGALHDLQQRFDRQRERYTSLVVELRALRPAADRTAA